MKNLLTFSLGRYINLMTSVFPGHAAALGFRLFCYPFRSQIKPYQRRFFNSAEQSELEHEGIKIKTYRWNNGSKKILFLHGWQSHSFRWKNYVEALQGTDYTLYAIDAPGHGLSSGNFLTVPLYSDIVEKFIHQVGGVDAIISHSLGSFTALYTLHRLPLLPVKKMVLLASPGEATEFISFYQKTLDLSPRAIENIKDHFETVIAERVEYFSAPKFAQSLSIPGLIIHDEDDDETSFRHSEAIHKAWKKSTLQLTKGLTHNLKSPSIVEAVIDFVQKEALAKERMESIR